MFASLTYCLVPAFCHFPQPHIAEFWFVQELQNLEIGLREVEDFVGIVLAFGTGQSWLLMMIAFITIKSSLVPLIEGLCAQIYFRFEISLVCSHLLLFFFVKEKTS